MEGCGCAIDSTFNSTRYWWCLNSTGHDHDGDVGLQCILLRSKAFKTNNVSTTSVRQFATWSCPRLETKLCTDRPMILYGINLEINVSITVILWWVAVENHAAMYRSFGIQCGTWSGPHHTRTELETCSHQTKHTALYWRPLAVTLKVSHPWINVPIARNWSL